MTILDIVLVTVGCAIVTLFLLHKSKKELINDHIHDGDSCVMKGDMYCSHAEWCEVEKLLFPEQYEWEIKMKDEEKGNSSSE